MVRGLFPTKKTGRTARSQTVDKPSWRRASQSSVVRRRRKERKLRHFRRHVRRK